MEIHVTEAKSGAIRQSWSRDSIRAVFAEIKAQKPKANHTMLVKLLAERIADDDDARLAAADYIVTNFLEAETKYHTRTRTYNKRSSDQIKQDVATASENLTTQILQLNLEMPNGKKMRHCTGTEMGKFGKGYARIARRVGSKTVGSVLDESEVRKLMQ
jgi:hypothetical protein